MDHWNDFFVAVAGASAALAGLIFVGVSISLTKILTIKGLADRGLLSLQLLLSVLITALLFLIPGQRTATLGTEILITGIVVYTVTLFLDIRIFNARHNRLRWLYVFYFILDHAATIPIIIAGVSMISGTPGGEYWIVPGILCSIMKAVVDGWVLLVEINR